MKSFTLLMIISLVLVFCSVTSGWGCTIAVVSAKASKTGRPFLWKNRDYGQSAREEISYKNATRNNAGAQLYVAGETFHLSNQRLVSGGINDTGFAIINSSVMEEPLRELANVNHLLLEKALETCATLKDFEAYLNTWFGYYFYVICGNFGVIDATGGAAMYEVWSDGSNHLKWVKYDANETEEGYVVRANSHETDGYVRVLGGTTIRYERAKVLFKKLVEESDLSPRGVLRVLVKDVGNDCDKFATDCEACDKYDDNYKNGNPDPANFNTDWTLNRNSTNSAYVIDGAATQADLPLMTLYCALGEPAYTPALPYFIYGRKVPYLARADYINTFGAAIDSGIGCFLNKASMNLIPDYQLYSNNGVGSQPIDRTIDYGKLLEVQKWLLPLEEEVLDTTDFFLAFLRANPEFISKEVLFQISDHFTRYGMSWCLDISIGH